MLPKKCAIGRLETNEQRDARLETDRELHARSKRTTDLKLSTFYYDVNYNYIIHPNLVFGKMDVLRKYFNVFKF